MRPKKIYLNDETRSQNDICRYWEYVTEKRIKENDAEYTDLTQVWHDASERPQVPEGMKNVQILTYRAIKVMDSMLVSNDISWERLCNTYGIVQWLYTADIRPKEDKE